jgi:ligand-binding sensor domain-containing protein
VERVRTRRVAIALAVLIGAGCGQVAQPTSTPEATPVASRTPPVASATPTSLATLAPSSTPNPTVALSSTVAPPSATPTPVVTPIPRSRADWTSYTNSNQITDLAFDGDGNLWAASSGGVVRWNLVDGTHIKYTSEDGLADHSVSSVAIAADGTVWLGTRAGAVRFSGQAALDDPPADAWTTYTWKDGVPSEWITSVAVAPDGAVWVGTLREGAARFDGESWTGYRSEDGLVSNDVRAIAFAADGAVWFGTCALWGPASLEPPPCFGVSRLEGAGTSSETWTTYSEEDGLANNRVNAIAVAPDGAVWFGTGPMDYYPWGESSGIGGVSQFHGDTWRTYTADDGLAENWVNDIAVAADGALWFATASGLSRFDGAVWHTYTASDGLASDQVASVAIAADGGVCAGTDRGVSCLQDAQWVTYVLDGPVSNLVPSIAVAPDGTVWAGSGQPVPAPENVGRGVSRFDGERWVGFTQEDGLADDTVVDIAIEPSGVVWFVTGDPDDPPGGVSRFDGATWTTFGAEEGPIPEDVRSIAVGPDGVVWFASRYGLTRYDPSLEAGPDEGAWKTYDVSAIRVAVGGEGTVWLAHDGGGISRFVRGKRYGVRGLSTRRIQCIAAGLDGTLWVGTVDDGVLHFDGESWTAYTIDDGLLDDYVVDIAVAADGVVWAAVGGGASRYDGVAWVSFAREDGLASNYVLSVAVGSDGAVWFGTGGGVSRYKPVDH